MSFAFVPLLRIKRSLQKLPVDILLRKLHKRLGEVVGIKLRPRDTGDLDPAIPTADLVDARDVLKVPIDHLVWTVFEAGAQRFEGATGRLWQRGVRLGHLDTVGDCVLVSHGDSGGEEIVKVALGVAREHSERATVILIPESGEEETDGEIVLVRESRHADY